LEKIILKWHYFTAFQLYFRGKKKKKQTKNKTPRKTYNGQEKELAKIHSSLDTSFKPLSLDGIGCCE